MKSILASVAMLAAIGSARAQCTCSPAFATAVSSGDSVTICCTETSGVWDLAITAHSDGGNNEVTVTVLANSSGTVIDDVVVRNDAGSGVVLRVTLEGAPGGLDNIQSIDTLIRHSSSNGPVRVDGLRVAQDVGTTFIDDLAVRATAIGTVRAGQDLRGRIETLDGDLDELLVLDGMFGDVTVNGSIGTIEVTNGIGQSTNQTVIEATDSIGYIRSHANAIPVYADIYVRETGSGPYGPAGRLEFDFVPQGVIHIDEFDDIAGGGLDAGLFVRNALQADITLEGSLDEPMLIEGSVRADILIKGGATADIEVTGTLGVAGTWVGTLTIGTQGSSTPITGNVEFLDSLVDGEIHLNAPYAGTFSVDGDVGASMDAFEFYGGLSGTLLIWGSTDPEDAFLDADIVIGNSNGSHAGAFSATGLIEIRDGLRTAASILIKEQCQGDILVHAGVNGPITAESPIESTSLIQIGGSLLSSGVIHAKSTGATSFAGQIIINSFQPTPAGTWAGTVKYGTGSGTTITHSGGRYGTASSAWGGGAIGLVPFHLHDEDCSPVNGGSTSGPSATLRFYGPVTWDAEEFPFSVSYCDGGDCEVGSHDDSSNWSVASGRGTRTVTLTRASSFPTGWHFHVQPILEGDARLLCDVVPSSVVVGEDFTYTFYQP